MRVLLADLKGANGFVSKDTVAGGYGSRLRPFSRTAAMVCMIKRRLHSPPSVQMAYLAALAATKGHETRWTSGARGDDIEADVAIVLSSLVDYRQETAWADALRARGTRVGFVGLAASKMPELFEKHADFVVAGNRRRRSPGCSTAKSCAVWSKAPDRQPRLPAVPRWDLVGGSSNRTRTGRLTVRRSAAFRCWPAAAAGFCTYCPHRLLADHRARSIDNIVEELEALCELYPNPYVIFRDPLFSDDRERCLGLCDAILSRGIRMRFECETRLDRLDQSLLSTMHRAGLRAISFGVESVATDTLKKAGRRPIPPKHQREIVDFCRDLGIATAAFYVRIRQDTWGSIAQTIDYAINLGSTFAQFKILTPYPGTPLWRQMKPLVCEQDWEKFDRFTPTFTHPNLTAGDLMFLLGAA